ncbi:hypothetical protein Aes508_107 [Aeromonas phage Aes508]|uniref:Uncharacterized protein n=1 Tax=Aeromonas phage Aes508 TaxID=1198013 RepID=J7KLI5_9CAUD|nr:hypothetical protein F484_gp106 [Aeromonas phage Aes508]AFQ97189.1 hypothetical protein Aes508_107 [Aeromonas phage Aes508]
MVFPFYLTNGSEEIRSCIYLVVALCEAKNMDKYRQWPQSTGKSRANQITRNFGRGIRISLIIAQERANKEDNSNNLISKQHNIFLI